MFHPAVHALSETHDWSRFLSATDTGFPTMVFVVFFDSILCHGILTLIQKFGNLDQKYLPAHLRLNNKYTI
jgi:hypothetical protein